MGIQHLPVIVGLRRGAVNTGQWEDEYGTKLFLNLERHGNSLGFAPSERQKFIEKNQLPYYDGTQEYCFWLGCMGATIRRAGRLCWRWHAYFVTRASLSACCGKRNVPATRRAGWATTWPLHR